MAGSIDETSLARVQGQACSALGCADFRELAAVVLARSFLKQGKVSQAKRLLNAYYQRDAASPLVRALCVQAGLDQAP